MSELLKCSSDVCLLEDYFTNFGRLLAEIAEIKRLMANGSIAPELTTNPQADLYALNVEREICLAAILLGICTDCPRQRYFNPPPDTE